MDELSRQLREAPGEATPGRDLWPGIQAGMHAEPQAGPQAGPHTGLRGLRTGRRAGQGAGRPTSVAPMRRWQRAAAAILLFGAGAVSGSLVERARSVDGLGQDGTDALGEVFADATGLRSVAELQRAGSDYVAAVARLRDLDAGDEALRAQGYEVAMGVVSVAAREVTAALGPTVDDRLTSSADRAHAELSARVSALLRGTER